MRAKRLIVLASVLALGACNGGDGGDGGTGGDAFGEPLQFQATQAFLPGLNVDTGWLPEGSPASVRATVTSSGDLTVVAQATTDGASLTPVAGSGALSFGGGLSLEISARIDAAGVQYEGVVESFAYAIEPASETFEPFAIGEPVSVTTMLPAQELGEVPIPSVPGATLRMEVTGGEVTNAFTGTCADAADGLGQYTGETTVSGTVACAATIVIEVPLIGGEEFGPFAFDVPIPEVTTAVDLGTRSLTTGEEVTEGGPCDGAAAATSASSATTGTMDPSGADDDSDTGGPAGDTGDTGTADSSDDGSTTGRGVGDPDYPAIVDDTCPGATLPASVAGDDGVCLPPCGASGTCPSGATGTSVGVCAVNPASSLLMCTDADADCLEGEICSEGTCFLQPPTYCVLACDGAVCPDEMSCVFGVCTYA